MQRLNLAKQITVLAATLIAALAIMAAISLISTIRLSNSVLDYKVINAKSVLTADIVEDIAEARLAALRFRTSGSPEAAEDVISNIEEVTSVAKELRELAGEGDPVVDPVRSVEGNSISYRTFFEDTVAIRSQRNAAVAELSEAGRTARAQITEIMNSTFQAGNSEAAHFAGLLQQELLLGRFYAERFLLNNDDASLDRSREQWTTTMAAVQPLRAALTDPNAVRTLDEVVVKIETFVAALDTVSELIDKRNEERAEMDRLGPLMLDEIDSVREALTERSISLGAEVVNDARTVVIALAVVALIAISLGTGFAYQIGRIITSQINKLVENMDALSGGDLSIEYEHQETKKEIGRIYNALKVFRDQALEAREQKKREEELRAQQDRAREEAAAQAEKVELERQKRQREDEARLQTLNELAGSIASVVERAAAGDFSHRIEQEFGEPELDAMADSINTLIKNVDTGITETGRVLKRMSNGEFDTNMVGEFSGAFDDLQTSVNSTIGALAELVTDIMAESAAVAQQSGKMTDISENLARRAEHQAASLEETSAAMREISENARKGADEAGTARERADHAVSKVDEAGRVVTNAIEAMEDIKVASGEIEEIVSVIEGIAFQTNLLALNASVEAARAGSAGKGFAVVATEVRDLAQRSADASQNIKTLIEKSSSKIEAGVGLVESTGGTLSEVVEIVREMSNSMSEIANASRDQAAGVSEIQSAIATLDDLTQKNAQVSDQTREDAKTLNAASTQMRQKIGQFKTGTSYQASAA